MEAAKSNSFLVRFDLSRCSFEINHEKSKWEPENKFSWIGYDVDTHNGCIFANGARIEKLCSDLDGICAKLELSAFIHAEEIASVVGQIISMASSWGNVPQSMTRHLHHIINSRSLWNSVVFVHDQLRKRGVWLLERQFKSFKWRPFWAGSSIGRMDRRNYSKWPPV